MNAGQRCLATWFDVGPKQGVRQQTYQTLYQQGCCVTLRSSISSSGDAGGAGLTRPLTSAGMGVPALALGRRAAPC